MFGLVRGPPSTVWATSTSVSFKASIGSEVVNPCSHSMTTELRPSLRVDERREGRERDAPPNASPTSTKRSRNGCRR